MSAERASNQASDVELRQLRHELAEAKAKLQSSAAFMQHSCAANAMLKEERDNAEMRHKQLELEHKSALAERDERARLLHCQMQRLDEAHRQQQALMLQVQNSEKVNMVL